jgi:hypothetical protein
VVPPRGSRNEDQPKWACANDPISEPPPVNDERLRQGHIQRGNRQRRPGGSRESSRILRPSYRFMEWKESAPGFRRRLTLRELRGHTDRLIRVLSRPAGSETSARAGDPNAHPWAVASALGLRRGCVPGPAAVRSRAASQRVDFRSGDHRLGVPGLAHIPAGGQTTLKARHLATPGAWTRRCFAGGAVQSLAADGSSRLLKPESPAIPR